MGGGSDREVEVGGCTRGTVAINWIKSWSRGKDISVCVDGSTVMYFIQVLHTGIHPVVVSSTLLTPEE